MELSEEDGSSRGKIAQIRDDRTHGHMQVADRKADGGNDGGVERNKERYERVVGGAAG